MYYKSLKYAVIFFNISNIKKSLDIIYQLKNMNKTQKSYQFIF